MVAMGNKLRSSGDKSPVLQMLHHVMTAQPSPTLITSDTSILFFLPDHGKTIKFQLIAHLIPEFWWILPMTKIWATGIDHTIDLFKRNRWEDGPYNSDCLLGTIMTSDHGLLTHNLMLNPGWWAQAHIWASLSNELSQGVLYKRVRHFCYVWHATKE